ncbi:16S rRNA (cytosine(1402)-N(4))-methyltransferase RsmH [Inmirania thermothiophila]|uniref:Ribosomal RNA small subunit methyltransferase H n=1 Tax=Inmirania thermothiophila TaxID=1750597 RepID=A0A3N1XSP9_9GAMM|nr:16S rRNA (cytosine(1402)-N(4))-methyltransferase RsmH [Inmirania thermothiophila]ROR29676.1 16S rRNA (cytosine1402-N4)-methyltransferase [Inmirania thermothiophila]
MAHVPVMPAEVLESLAVRPQGCYVDATYGRGGHAAAILAQLGPEGRLVVMDRDPEAVAHARRHLGGDPRVWVLHGSFARLGELLAEAGVAGGVDGLLMDLGVSSPQLDDPARGFSFLRDGPLDMRMDPDEGESAAAWLARAGEREIAQVLRDYGEERYARRIARAICAARAEGPIRTTGRLAAVVAAAVPTREPGRHPATRTFQALRIRVNGELEALEAALPQAVEALAPGGRLAVIAFHSLEDRIVKRFLRREARGGDGPPDLPLPASAMRPRLRLLGRARRPGAAEVEANPRARSAVLRVAERLP